MHQSHYTLSLHTLIATPQVFHTVSMSLYIYIRQKFVYLKTNAAINMHDTLVLWNCASKPPFNWLCVVYRTSGVSWSLSLQSSLRAVTSPNCWRSLQDSWRSSEPATSWDRASDLATSLSSSPCFSASSCGCDGGRGNSQQWGQSKANANDSTTHRITLSFQGKKSRIRTRDTLQSRRALYQLSYY